MKKNIRSIICLTMAVFLMISMSAVTFASTEISENKAQVSNRYYFVTEKGDLKLLSTTTKTASELAKESVRKAWINSLAGIATGKYLGAGAAVTELVAEAHGYGTAAKIEVYSRTDKRYRVDSVTGNRTLSSTKHYIIYKLYVRGENGYELYKTRQCVRG